MATYPCSRCGSRYRGPQQTAYPAVVDGITVYRQRMRLCPGDFEELVNLPWLRLVQDPDEATGSECSRCGSENARWAVFVPYYEHGQGRTDLFGRLCAGNCLHEGLRALYGPQHDAQAASDLQNDL